MVELSSGLQESKQTLWKDLHPDRRQPGNTLGETTTNFFFPFFPKNPVAISQAQNSKQYTTW
jgi:hypothetical protein